MTTTTERLEANKEIARDYIDQVFNQHNPGQPRTETFHHQHHSDDPATNSPGLGPRSPGSTRDQKPLSRWAPTRARGA